MRPPNSNTAWRRNKNRGNTVGIMLVALLSVCLIIMILVWVSFVVKQAPMGPLLPPSLTSPESNNAAAATLPEVPVVSTFTPIVPAATNSQVDGMLSTMSLEQKTGQMILMDVVGTELTAEDCQTVQQVMPGGIVFHNANGSDPDQLRRLISDIKACAAATTGIPLIFALDHEGQFINRFESGMTVFPSAQALGATANPGYAYQVALAGGQELSSTGINMGPRLAWQSAVAARRVLHASSSGAPRV